MTQAEAAVAKDTLHKLLDVELPALVAAEEAKLPAAYQGIIQTIVGGILPALIAKGDAMIEADIVGDAAVAAPVAPAAGS